MERHKLEPTTMELRCRKTTFSMKRLIYFKLFLHWRSVTKVWLCLTISWKNKSAFPAIDLKEIFLKNRKLDNFPREER
jgi:hypothetical protein